MNLLHQIQSNVGCMSSKAEIEISLVKISLVKKAAGKWSEAWSCYRRKRHIYTEKEDESIPIQ